MVHVINQRARSYYESNQLIESINHSPCTILKLSSKVEGVNFAKFEMTLPISMLKMGIVWLDSFSLYYHLSLLIIMKLYLNHLLPPVEEGDSLDDFPPPFI